MLKTVSAHPARGHVLCYEFAMRRPDAKQTIGIIHLRFDYSAKLRYVAISATRSNRDTTGTATSSAAVAGERPQP